MSEPFLDFERPIVELERQIEALREIATTHVPPDGLMQPELAGEIERLEARAHTLRREIFAELTPWQKVLLSRHPLRPYTLDYLERLVDGFMELHGDRRFGDDEAIVAGLGTLRCAGLTVAIVGHQKGRSTKENLRRNFGMPRPEGYRKALRVMEVAARAGHPIVTLIDTPGAFPGIDAEERGQAEAVAHNLEAMSLLPVPIVATVIGEGGSGGALAIGVGDCVLMLEFATYSVISPEGCASILWRDPAKAPEAAAALRIDAASILRLGAVDEVVAEPPGGAHRDPEAAAALLGKVVARHLGELCALAPTELLERRYARLRRPGAVVEAASAPPKGGAASPRPTGRDA